MYVYIYTYIYYIVCVLISSSGEEGNIYLDSNSQDHFSSVLGDDPEATCTSTRKLSNKYLGDSFGLFCIPITCEGSQNRNRAPGIQLENLQNGQSW